MRVSIASVETNTSGVIALGTTIVTAFTGSGGDDCSYKELTPDGDRSVSRLGAGERRAPRTRVVRSQGSGGSRFVDDAGNHGV